MNLHIDELAMLRIAHVNPRTEEHGEEMLPALDVRIEWETGARVLDEFHPELRGAMYWANETSRAQGEVEGVEEYSGDLIFPDLGPLKWKGDGPRVTLAIELGSLAPVVLPACKLGGVMLELKPEGIVVVSFRLQCCPVGEREAGKLSTMIGARVMATLKPAPDPEPDAPAGNGEDKEPNLAAWPFGVTGDEIPASARPLKVKPTRRKRADDDPPEGFAELLEAQAEAETPHERDDDAGREEARE